MKAVQLPKRFLEKYPEFAGQVAHLRYARDDFRQPVGVVLVDVTGRAGYSIVNKKMGDRFDAVTGIRKALYRLGSGNTLNDIKRMFYPDYAGCSPEYAENAQAMYTAAVEVERYSDDSE